MLSALTAFIAALLLGSTQPQTVTIPEPYMKEFTRQALFTWLSGVESLYCVQGYHKRGHFRVTGVVKPKQITTQSRIETKVQEPDTTYTKVEFMSGVTAFPCGKGTIFVLHTHPFGGRRAE